MLNPASRPSRSKNVARDEVADHMRGVVQGTRNTGLAWGMDSKLFHDMFVLGLPVAEKILRPTVVYMFLVVGLRLAGKRELAQLNPFDLVVLLTLSNTVQNAIIGDDNSVTGG